MWTACVELNNANAFAKIIEESEQLSFRKSGIDFYPNSNLREYSLLLKQHYDVLVIDFGVLNQNTIQEFFHCDVCLTLGYISPWNCESYWNWFSHLRTLYQGKDKEIICMGNLATALNVREFKHQHGVVPVAIPFLENPFQLTSDQWKFIERALEKGRYTTHSLFFNR